MVDQRTTASTGIPGGQAAQPSWPSVLVSGIGVAIPVWITWFLTHLPWLGLEEKVSIPAILGVWVLAMGWNARWLRGRGYFARCVLAGIVSAGVGLLILGTKLVAPAADGSATASGLVPNAGLIVAGFLAVGAMVGLIGGGMSLGAWGGASEPEWGADEAVARSARATVFAAAPLLLVGGLVTSTNSGMAVPDWPNTYGSNMFLYPLGPRASPSVFLEHAHRLFGTLLGLCALVQTLLTLRAAVPKKTKVWTLIVLGLVVVQGVLGGVRVLFGHADAARDLRWNALLHGVLGQLVFAAAVVVAASQTRGYRDGIEAAGTMDGGRKLRALGTAALHALFPQLLFGAMYRHLRSPHALWTHVGFSLVVVAAATIAAFTAMRCAGSLLPRDRPFARSLEAAAKGAVGVVFFQFLLGWATFFMGGETLTPDSNAQALLRTAHQANGAALLGVAAWLATLARLVPRRIH